MKNNKIVVDTNVFISALLIKKSIPFQVVNIAFKLGKILYSDATYIELQQVLFRRKFDKYLTLEERNIFLFKLALCTGQKIREKFAKRYRIGVS